jgi:hypothetical protein
VSRWNCNLLNTATRLLSKIRFIYLFVCGPGSVVGIATGYGLDGPGIESRWGEIFRTCPERPWSPPSFLYNGYRVFPGGKERPGRDADPSPPSSAVVKERVELYLYFPMGRTACTEPQCLHKGALYFVTCISFFHERTHI